MSAYRIFSTAQPTVRFYAGKLLPINPREDAILDELRRRRNAAPMVRP